MSWAKRGIRSWCLVGLLVALALVGLAACGAGGDENPGLSVDEDFARYSASDVAEHFERVTGVRLDQKPGGPTLEFLDMPSGSESDPARGRYGNFIVAVTKNERTLQAIRSRGTGGDRVFANVLVQPSSSTADDERFRRVVAALETLGKPPEEVRLPPEETPCGTAGIDPDGGSTTEGTCKLGQQTLRIVNGGSKLDLPGKVLSGVRVKGGNVLTLRRYGFTRRFRAQGAFVAVTFRLENTGDEPLDNLKPSLVVEGKRYTPDIAKQYYLQPNDPFPIQPGAHETVGVLFDIPVPAAKRATTEGALELIADPETTTLDSATNIARIRLPRGRPTGGGAGSVS